MDDFMGLWILGGEIVEKGDCWVWCGSSEQALVVVRNFVREAWMSRVLGCGIADTGLADETLSLCGTQNCVNPEHNIVNPGRTHDERRFLEKVWFAPNGHWFFSQKTFMGGSPQRFALGMALMSDDDIQNAEPCDDIPIPPYTRVRAECGVGGCVNPNHMIGVYKKVLSDGHKIMRGHYDRVRNYREWLLAMEGRPRW